MSAAITEGFALWRECRDEFDGELWRRYALAEEACNGALLNARGRAKGVDPVRLFYGSRVHAHAYASDELVEWWLSNPRLTFAEFERSWLAQREAFGTL